MVLSPQQGCERGSSSLFTKTWHAGVPGPPRSASEVSLGQIKGSVLAPAGEDTDGTHYSKMRSRLEIEIASQTVQINPRLTVPFMGCLGPAGLWGRPTGGHRSGPLSEAGVRRPGPGGGARGPGRSQA